MVAQATRVTAYQGVVTVTENTVTVARHVYGGVQISGVQVARGGFASLFAAYGISGRSGSAQADDEVDAEIALAKARGDVEHRQLVCVRPDRTVYPVPSTAERCMRTGEELKALEQPINPQALR